MFLGIWNTCKFIFKHVKETLEQWTKPTPVTLAASAVEDLTRSKSNLVVQNAILRQQMCWQLSSSIPKLGEFKANISKNNGLRFAG